MLRLVVVISLTSLLAACGGQRTTPPPSPPPPNAARGVYISSYYHGFVTAIVLPDGQFYVPFRDDVQGSLVLSGVGIGQGTASSGTFSGTYQYSGELGPHSGSMNASFVAGTSLTGTLIDNGNNVAIQGNSYPSDHYNMDTPASSSAISGQWFALGVGGCDMTLRITEHGTITGTPGITSSCACDFSGTFSPDTKSNFYNVTLTFPPSGCPLQNQAATGIALVYRDGAYTDEFAMIVETQDGTATVITGVRDPNSPAPIP